MSSSLLHAVDPGPEFSALVVLDFESMLLPRVVRADKMTNPLLLDALRRGPSCDANEPLVIEKIEGMGLAVGAETFETCVWTGRFIEAWGGVWHRVTRRQVKLHLCGHMRAKDPHIRQALIDMFGGIGGKDVAIGKRKNPGPLFGVAGDCWSSLACGMTWWDTDRLLVGKS